jgi:uncharacterized protein
MPANLTPKYHKAELAFRQAQTSEEEFDCLQLMLRELPKHKGTDKLQANLKQRISRIKQDILASAQNQAKRKGFRLARQGAGRAVILGAPNSGKSQLLASLTRATPEIAAYPFTTREPLPGMMAWEDVFVQLVDTPPITRDFLATEIHPLIRSAEVAILLLDLSHDEGGDEFQTIIRRLNQSKTRLSNVTEISADDVGVTFTKTIVVANKCDAPSAADRLAYFREMYPHTFPEIVISATERIGLNLLSDSIFRALNVIRIYTKIPGNKTPDFEHPFTLAFGATVADVAELVHVEVAKKLKYAKVWGDSVNMGVSGETPNNSNSRAIENPGTQVKPDHILSDQDVVELHATL